MSVALLHFKKAMRFIATRGPKFATFFVTTRCNRRCDYCVVTKRSSPEITTQNWSIITDRVINYGVCLISIVGGEPTLRGDLLDIIRYASRKVLVSLTSNGDYFSEKNGIKNIQFLISAGLSSLTLSLHELKDLERQLDILSSAKKQGAIPVLATVATKKSIEYLPEVMRVTNKRGILFRYSLCQTVGGDFSPADTKLQPTKEQALTFTNIVRRQKQRTGLVLNTYGYLKKTSLYPDNWHCNSYKDYWLHINSDGTLMACSEWSTPIKITDILSLNDSRWVEARTKNRNACDGCTNHCYIEEEGINFIFECVKGEIEYSIALLRSKL